MGSRAGGSHTCVVVLLLNIKNDICRAIPIGTRMCELVWRQKGSTHLFCCCVSLWDSAALGVSSTPFVVLVGFQPY